MNAVYSQTSSSINRSQ